MLSGISGYRIAASGPVRLCNGLKKQSSVLRRALHKKPPVQAVGASISRDILGGDLINLLSKGLQERLMENGPPELPVEIHQPRSVQFPMISRTQGFNNQSDTLPLHEVSHKHRAFDAVNAASNSGSWDAIAHGEASTKAVDTPTGAQEPASTPFARHVYLDQKHPTGANPLVPATSGSKLVMLLDKLDAQRHSSQAKTQQNIQAQQKHSVSQVHQQANPGSSHLPGSFMDPTPAQWTTRTGNHIARAVQEGQVREGHERTLHTGNQHMKAGSGDHVEINNTFHIDVHAGEIHPGGPGGDLSEKISTILREQAIQHGIDVS